MVGMSLKGIYMGAYFNTFNRMLETFKNKDVDEFNLYVASLRAMVAITDEIDRKIDARIGKAETLLKPRTDLDDRVKQFYVGFAAFNEMNRYLFPSMNLLHEEIVGRGYNIDGIDFDDGSESDAGTAEAV
jgi:hypothetical protein